MNFFQPVVLALIETRLPICWTWTYLFPACLSAASGVVKFLLPGLWGKYLLFFAFSILSLVLWKQFAKESTAANTDQSQLNRQNQCYKGRILALSEPVVNGFGKVKVDDIQ